MTNVGIYISDHVEEYARSQVQEYVASSGQGISEEELTDRATSLEDLWGYALTSMLQYWDEEGNFIVLEGEVPRLPSAPSKS
jgi:hypothetical protein